MSRPRYPVWTASLFVACIAAANFATSTYGQIDVGFGQEATAGTLFAGLTFVLRDTLQDLTGPWRVMALIVVGAAVSYLLSEPFIALASGIAFLVSELADLGVWTPLRARYGYVRAAVASNTVGAFVDTVLFLSIAGFPLWSSVPGQMIGKLAITGLVVLAVGVAREVLRNPVTPRGA